MASVGTAPQDHQYTLAFSHVYCFKTVNTEHLKLVFQVFCLIPAIVTSLLQLDDDSQSSAHISYFDGFSSRHIGSQPSSQLHIYLIATVAFFLFVLHSKFHFKHLGPLISCLKHTKDSQVNSNEVKHMWALLSRSFHRRLLSVSPRVSTLYIILLLLYHLPFQGEGPQKIQIIQNASHLYQLHTIPISTYMC